MILVTGATGFIGGSIVDRLSAESVPFKVLIRSLTNSFPEELVIHSDLESLEELGSRSLDGVQSVVHCASIAHNLDGEINEVLSRYRKINRDATLSLASLAAKSGVERFVFLSSIKVNGETTQPDLPFTEADDQNLTDPYGISKLEAELGLLKIAKLTGMEVVIVRPPLVYGPGVKGNFAKMVSWVRRGIPMPFGMVNNQRSLLALDNLVDFLVMCADKKRSPGAANQVFLLADKCDVSTRDLLQKVANAYKSNVRFLPVPVFVMKFIAKLLGKGDLSSRLFGNLQVDSSKAPTLLGWRHVVTMDEQLEKMAKYDLRQEKK